MTKAVVIINGQHSLLTEQEEWLNRFDEVEFFKIPDTGLTLLEQRCAISDLCCNDVVFISPVPFMLGYLSANFSGRVWVAHNDRREKKELPNGRVVSVVAKTGWKFICVNRKM